jgi:hypothetical protein
MFFGCLGGTAWTPPFGRYRHQAAATVAAMGGAAATPKGCDFALKLMRTWRARTAMKRLTAASWGVTKLSIFPRLRRFLQIL